MLRVKPRRASSIFHVYLPARVRLFAHTHLGGYECYLMAYFCAKMGTVKQCQNTAVQEYHAARYRQSNGIQVFTVFTVVRDDGQRSGSSSAVGTPLETPFLYTCRDRRLFPRFHTAQRLARGPLPATVEAVLDDHEHRRADGEGELGHCGSYGILQGQRRARPGWPPRAAQTARTIGERRGPDNSQIWYRFVN